MHSPIDDEPALYTGTPRSYLQIDGQLLGPVRRSEDHLTQGLFTLMLGGVMTHNPALIIGEAQLVSQATADIRHIECLTISQHQGSYQVLCADLGPVAQPNPRPTDRKTDHFLLKNSLCLTGIHDLFISTPQPENEPGLLRFTLDTESWRLLGLNRDSCSHCDAQHTGPCDSARLDRRAMRSVIYPAPHLPQPPSIELLDLPHRRRLLLEPIAVTSDRFAQVRLLSRIRSTANLAGRHTL